MATRDNIHTKFCETLSIVSELKDKQSCGSLVRIINSYQHLLTEMLVVTSVPLRAKHKYRLTVHSSLRLVKC